MILSVISPVAFAVRLLLSGAIGTNLSSVLLDPHLYSNGQSSPIAIERQFGSTLFRHTGGVLDFAMSADRQLVASASTDKTIRIWNARTGQEIKRCILPGGTKCLALSFESETVACTDGNDIFLWRWPETAKAQRLEVPSRGREDPSTFGLCLSSDGKLLASFNVELGIRLWDIASRKELAKLGGKPAAGALFGYRIMAFAKDDAWFAYLDSDISIALLDVKAQRVIRRFVGHENRIRALVFSSDGRMVASAGDDGTVRVWEVASGQPRRVFNNGAPCQSLSFCPADKLIAAGSAGRMKVWSMVSGDLFQERECHRTGITSSAFLPNGHLLLTAGEDEAIQCWDVRTGAAVEHGKGHLAALECLAFSPDEKTFTSASRDGMIAVWGVTESEPRRWLRGHTRRVVDVAFTPAGDKVVSASWDGTIRVWDAQSGKEIRVIQGLGERASMALVNNGEWVASCGMQNLIGLWNVSSGEQLKMQPTLRRPLKLLAFPKSSRLAVLHDKSVSVWVPTEDKTLTLFDDKSLGKFDRFNAMAISPDERFLACAVDWRVKVWEVGTGKLVETSQGSGRFGKVCSVLFCNDNRTIICGTEDGYLLQAAVGSNKLEIVAQIDCGRIACIQRLGNAKQFITGNGNSTATLWNMK